MVIPSGYHILVEPVEAKQKSKGGILMPDRAVEREQAACVVGLVLAMGPDCYIGDKYVNGPWCKEGDYVLFRAYSGTRVRIAGKEYRIINDDTVEGVVSNPDEVERA